MNRVKLFTHTDLDGIGCAIVAYLAFGKENVDVEYCNYDDVNERVFDFARNLDLIEKYNKVFITDISLDEGTSAYIDGISSIRGYNRFVLLDHHKTAEWLNKYEWASVSSVLQNEDYVSKFDVGSKTCGTQLFYQWLLDAGELTDMTYELLYSFVENVRQYDTWECKEIYKNDYPKKLNDLMYIYGRDLFIEKYVDRIESHIGNLISKEDKLILKGNQEKIDKYVNSCNRKILEVKDGTYSFGIVFAEQYISEVGNKLCELNNGLDFIAVVNIKNETISYRTIRDDVDVSEIAKLNGGGGHPKAAGSQFDAFSYYEGIASSIRTVE